jgi:hypothetical protein
MSRITVRTADGKEIIPSKEEAYFFTIGKSEVSDSCCMDITIGYLLRSSTKIHNVSI